MTSVQICLAAFRGRNKSGIVSSILCSPPDGESVFCLLRSVLFYSTHSDINLKQFPQFCVAPPDGESVFCLLRSVISWSLLHHT